MGCRDFFTENIENGDRCKELQNQPPSTQLTWEQEKASEHSPGPVQDKENLVRYWLNPVHFDPQTGAWKPTAFDDASNKGLSVNRLDHVTLSEVKTIAQGRVDNWIEANANKARRELIGYSVFSAGETRAIEVAGNNQSRRGLGVYDTAKAISLYTTFLRFRPSPLGACKCLIHMSRGVLPIINMTNRKPLIYMEFLSCV